MKLIQLKKSKLYSTLIKIQINLFRFEVIINKKRFGVIYSIMFPLKIDMHESFYSGRRIERNSLKNLIFELYHQLYHRKTIDEKSTFKLKATETIWCMVWCFQMLSLLWIPSLAIAYWKENITLWKAIGYFRLDNVCSEFGIIKWCFYSSIMITFILIISVAFLAISIYFSWTIPALFGAFKSFFNFWQIYFLIPSVTLYSIFLKYAILPKNYISEYKNNNHLEDFEISAVSEVAIILSLIIDFILLYFFTQFSSEIRHSESRKTLKAKAHSKVDSHIAIFTYFLPILYVFCNENYMVYFQTFMMIISVIIMRESDLLLPNFSLYSNLAQALKLFTIFLASFGFVLGCAIDNSLVIIFIVVILLPICAVFVIQFTIKLHKSINTDIFRDIAEIHTRYELEKRLRHWLCSNDTDHKNEIIRAFEKFYIKNSSERDKLQIIWVVNYCLYALKDEPLARVKLRKTKTISRWNLEADFQEYLLNKILNESSTNECLQFLNYFQQINMIKTKDSKLCVSLLTFWEQLTSSKPDIKGLTNRLNWIDETISYLNNQYKRLLEEFSDSQECLTLYTSYTKDIIYDYEKSNLLEIKLKGLYNTNYANPESTKCSFLNNSRGILIISGEPDNFGRILFSNPRAAEIMKTSVDNIKNFIHQYYYESFKKEAQRLIHYGSNSEIDFSKGFFLNIPGKYLIECRGKAIITAIDCSFAFILNFETKNTKHQTVLLTETGEILCYSEHFHEFVGKYNKNLIGYNIKDLFAEAKISGNKWILHSNTKETILVMSCAQVYNLKVFYATLTSNHENIKKRKNKNSQYDTKAEEIINENLLSPYGSNERSYRSYQVSEEKYINSEVELIHPFSMESSEVIGSLQSDAKSQIPSQKKFFKMLEISSRSINILHLAFILSIIAVLSTNIVVLFYAFSYIDFIKNMDLSMAIAKAESRLQIAAYNSQLLLELAYINDPNWYQDLLTAWEGLPGYVNDVRDIYMEIISNLSKWNYCAGNAILTDKRIDVWENDYIKKTSLLDILSQSAQFGYDILRKYNNSEDYTKEVRYLKMAGFGYGYQYCNSSLYEIIDCQKSLMLDFKSVMLILLILGIGVLVLCFLVMIPFCYSVIKIENNLWSNLRKKAYRNFSEMKQSLLERLRNVHSQPELLTNNRNPDNTRFFFKNYWKYIWRICIYFIVVIAFSLLNITYFYENCTNYLAYRPEVLREIIRTKIYINTLAVSASDMQDYMAGIPLNYFFDIHNYPNTQINFQKSISELRDSRSTLRNPKYSPILSNDFKTMYYENDSQPYTHYLDYGTYVAEEEQIDYGYIIAHLNVTNDAWRWWYYNMTLFRANYDKYANIIDSYSQKVIDDQVSIIVTAFSIFVAISIVVYFLLYFVFFKNEKKYLQKINSMMRIMPV
ncbi:unnamed protein product [Blepharisma stoltei]|uniref:TmcB/TmcC TPR repeats domain-containing protein n=1 Tax=Blepharisma stoltei TaxID=1481888 RepID=A0AAU9IAF9_9CILI|nr:unnamed protein product [Blepharisma stoltei]